MPYSRLLVLPFEELNYRDVSRLSYTGPTDKEFHGKFLDAKAMCPRKRSVAKALMPPRELLLWHFEQCVIRCFQKDFPERSGILEAELERSGKTSKTVGKRAKTDGKETSRVSFLIVARRGSLELERSSRDLEQKKHSSQRKT
jgi:hypothetical protein